MKCIDEVEVGYFHAPLSQQIRQMIGDLSSIGMAGEDARGIPMRCRPFCKAMGRQGFDCPHSDELAVGTLMYISVQSLLVGEIA